MHEISRVKHEKERMDRNGCENENDNVRLKMGGKSMEY